MSLKEIHKQCRNSACIEFDKAIPNGILLMNEMEKYLCSLFERLGQINVTGEKDQHRLPLIVSFIRTHMMIDELLHYCENIEAATLVRKQLELLARYKETENMDELKIAIKMKKVPQISKIENGGVMYGMLSEIAHSAKSETYTLLGYEKQEDDSVGINLFGVYDENIKVTFGIHTDIFCRFFIEMLQFQKEHIENYSEDSDMDWMCNDFIPLGLKSGIEYFERYSR